MSSFSDLYMKSQVVEQLLRSVPESDRERFMEALRASVSQYDAFSAFSAGSSIHELLGSPSTEIPREEGRRPPRRR
jgi:hypothetical protein